MQITRKLSLFVLAGVLASNASPVVPSAPEVVDVGSSYQLPALAIGDDSAGWIGISGVLGGAGKLWVNPNTCALNEWGYPTICTLAMPYSRRITLELVNASDPTSQGARLYEIKGLRGSDRNFLRVPSDPSEPYALVHMERSGQVTRLVPLF